MLFLFLKIACFGGGDEQENLEEVVNNEEALSEDLGSESLENNLNLSEEEVDEPTDMENIDNSSYNEGENQGVQNLNEAVGSNQGSMESFSASNFDLENNSQPNMQESSFENMATEEVEENTIVEAPTMNEEDISSFPSRGFSGVAAGEGLPEMGSKMPYVVRKGDTLSKIAKRIFGDLKKWKHIADFSGLKNPDIIYPGEVVYYQLSESSLAFAKEEARQEIVEVVAKKGDTLSKLAQKYYGEKDLWKFIWRQNESIEEPDLISVGQVIFVLKSIDQVVSKENKIEEKEASFMVSNLEKSNIYALNSQVLEGSYLKDHIKR